MDLTNRDLIDAILVLNEGGGSGGGTGGDTGGKPAGGKADDESDGESDDDESDDDDEDDEPLGPKGRKALDAEKDRRRAATRELRKFKELGYTPEQIAELARKGKPAKDSSDDDGKADADELVKQAREDARKEAQREALHDRVQDKIEAKAAKAFADPEDAVAILLRTHKIEDFLDGDKLDADEIADALDELGKKKPHLLATGKRFQGGGDGGARPPASKRPGSLSEAVTTKMSNR